MKILALENFSLYGNTSPLFPNSSNYWEWLKSGRGQSKKISSRKKNPPFQNPRSAPASNSAGSSSYSIYLDVQSEFS